MKTICMGLLLALTLTTVSAQDFQPAAKAGAKSVNFTFGGLGSFGLGAAGINGGISLSYFLANDAALRLGLQATYTNATNPWNDATQTGIAGTDGSTSTMGFAVGADYLVFVNAASSRVRPYLGAGVSVRFASSDTKYSYANNSGTGTLTEVKNSGVTSGTAFGLSGILGAEFFLYPEISISGEYQLNVVSLTDRADFVESFIGVPSITMKNGSTLQVLGFGSGGATLHIYF